MRLPWFETRWINAADSDSEVAGIKLLAVGDMEINCEAVALEFPLKKELVIGIDVDMSLTVLVLVWFDIPEPIDDGLRMLDICDEIGVSEFIIPDIEDVVGALIIIVDICVMVDSEVMIDVKIEVWTWTEVNVVVTHIVTASAA